MTFLATPHASANDAAVSVAHISEDEGCVPYVEGPTRPQVGETGAMSSNVVIRGPWGDQFGRSKAQVVGSLVDWTLPGADQDLRVHERALPSFTKLAATIQAHIDSGDTYDTYAVYSWNWRTVGGATHPSSHAFGISLDINPAENPYNRDNVLETDMPEWFVQAFKDAGFCWGGDWLNQKDAQHYSWSGQFPAGELDSRWKPYAPLTSASGFEAAAQTFHTPGPARESDQIAMADMTGDGAADLVIIRGTGLVDVVTAHGGYGTVVQRILLPLNGRQVLFADHDLDGRPDAWLVDPTTESMSVEVLSHTSGFTESTVIPLDSAGSKAFVGYVDDDLIPDLFIIDETDVTVVGSGSGWSTIATMELPEDVDETWSFATADIDVDGVAELVATSAGDTPMVLALTTSDVVLEMSPSSPISNDAMVEYADLDGDGRDDLFVKTGRVLTMTPGGVDNGGAGWHERPGTQTIDLGPGCIGDACDTIGYVNGGGEWFLADAPAPETGVTDFYYGNPQDEPFMGDWDCDGVDTPGLYRRSDGFVYLRHTNTQGIADLMFYFGNPGDLPVVGDFNGDGCDTVSIYRESEQRFYIINELGEDGLGLGAADYFFDFGNPGDQPFVGDFDGDGDDEVGLLRPSTGYVYLKFDLAGGFADISYDVAMASVVALAGDWNGDGIDTVATFSPSSDRWFIRLDHLGLAPDHEIRFGASTGPSLPIAGTTGIG
jgi:hypothetical protein